MAGLNPSPNFTSKCIESSITKSLNCFFSKCHGKGPDASFFSLLVFFSRKGKCERVNSIKWKRSWNISLFFTRARLELSSILYIQEMETIKLWRNWKPNGLIGASIRFYRFFIHLFAWCFALFFSFIRQLILCTFKWKSCLHEHRFSLCVLLLLLVSMVLHPVEHNSITDAGASVSVTICDFFSNFHKSELWACQFDDLVSKTRIDKSFGINSHRFTRCGCN